jgi:hypothetical protein
MNTKKIVIVGALLSFVICLGVVAEEWAQNIRVVWSSNPQTDAVVVWDGETVDENAVLLYDTVSRKKAGRNYAYSTPISAAGLYTELPPKRSKRAAPDAPLPPPGPDLFYHHAKLTNLEAGTIYYLAVKTADGLGREVHFKTAPSDKQPLKLIYAGDSRSNIDVVRVISKQIAGMVEADKSIVAMLHGGDYATWPKRNVWKAWLEAYALTTTPDGKLLPIIPVVGNHESPDKVPLFSQAYGYPGGQLGYYAFRLTPSIGLLCLNTETSPEGDQQVFLSEALADLKKDQVKWKIVAYHRPVFPAIKNPSRAKASWVPLFEEYNVDLALESDGHCIKRTVPIRNDKESADGVVYLGEGGYGAPQRDPKPDRWYIQGDNAFASKGDHIMMLEITADAINYSTLLRSGEIVDSATFKPRQ